MQRVKFVMCSPDGMPYTVSKVHAFAVLSGHPRCSKDRSLRVQTMSRFVDLQLHHSVAEERCTADPEA